MFHSPFCMVQDIGLKEQRSCQEQERVACAVSTVTMLWSASAFHDCLWHGHRAACSAWGLSSTAPVCVSGQIAENAVLAWSQWRRRVFGVTKQQCAHRVSPLQDLFSAETAFAAETDCTF